MQTEMIECGKTMDTVARIRLNGSGLQTNPHGESECDRENSNEKTWLCGYVCQFERLDKHERVMVRHRKGEYEITIKWFYLILFQTIC